MDIQSFRKNNYLIIYGIGTLNMVKESSVSRTGQNASYFMSRSIKRHIDFSRKVDL